MTHFLINNKNIVIALTSSNKHIFLCYYDALFSYATAFCMNYNIFYTPYDFLKALRTIKKSEQFRNK